MILVIVAIDNMDKASKTDSKIQTSTKKAGTIFFSSFAS
jgi:hypothetical protein